MILPSIAYMWGPTVAQRETMKPSKVRQVSYRPEISVYRAGYRRRRRLWSSWRRDRQSHNAVEPSDVQPQSRSVISPTNFLYLLFTRQRQHVYHSTTVKHAQKDGAATDQHYW